MSQTTLGSPRGGGDGSSGSGLSRWRWVAAACALLGAGVGTTAAAVTRKFGERSWWVLGDGRTSEQSSSELFSSLDINLDGTVPTLLSHCTQKPRARFRHILNQMPIAHAVEAHNP